ncbi:hypothetical protein B7R22_16625 [Subtercola boreus]|uniref:Uncharacterized protein n=1 Tax=Subtercola boreus TaxID=120213 RepID=A0A3E0VQJ0_9MICO|nr:hypothetical protein B7R22_16625 [Subtercola boreus]
MYADEGFDDQIGIWGKRAKGAFDESGAASAGRIMSELFVSPGDREGKNAELGVNSMEEGPVPGC